jgi:hypothetical protein
LFLSFKNGNLYKHWNGATPNTFYGGLISDNAPIAIGIPGNINENDVKKFLSLEIQTNFLLSCPNDTDITIEPNASYPNGQTSRLKANKFVKKEGKWYCAFDRNLLTPNLPVGQNAILDGNVLSGNAINVILSNDTHQGLILNKVIIKSMKSINLAP